MRIPHGLRAALASQGAAPPSAYQIQRSLRFDGSAYLSRTPASAGNRKTWTWSGWVKRSALGAAEQNLFGIYTAANNSENLQLTFTNDAITVNQWSGGYILQTSSVYRDVSAWYHIVLAVNTTQATASNRVKLYVNGTQVTAFSSTTYPAQNTDLAVNQAAQHEIGAWGYTSVINYFNGYLADIHFIDGQALTPTSFTKVDATTGQLIPKAYTGSFGTNGFHLPFSDNSTAAALGTDTSGNSNTWTVNNISVTAGAGNDSLVDTPTSYGTDTGAGGEVRGNYCTLNPLSLLASTTTTNGNLDASTPTTNGGGVFGTIAFPSSGKWYFEVTATTGNSSMIGISDYLSTSSNAWAISPSVFYWNNGKKYVNGADGGAYGATYTTNDIIGVAVNCDSGSVTFYKNNTSQGAITCTPTGLYPCLTDGTSSTADSFSVNFGQRPFAYTAPSGYKALCDTNLPTPAIAKPNTVMDVVLDTGANILTAAQSAIGGSADLLWIKDRANTNNHQLIDTVRGGTATLQSNTTAAETTYSAPSGSSVAWTWDAGSSTGTNTDGSITSNVRANASAGFSIVTYTGTSSSQSVGHGLNVAPSLIITKNRSVALSWGVYHSSLGANNYLVLDLPNAVDSASGIWGTVNSSVFGIANFNVNGKSNPYVAYCFAPVAGYSSFGSYTGNGSADGPFVYTGFAPAFVLIKRTNTTSNWTILDYKREGYNVDNDPLYPNLSNAEGTTDLLDINSNGFKLRSTDTSVNASSGTYIYFAVAQNPFQYARAR